MPLPFVPGTMLIQTAHKAERVTSLSSRRTFVVARTECHLLLQLLLVYLAGPMCRYCTCCWYRKVLETPKDSVCVRTGVCRGRNELCDKQNVWGRVHSELLSRAKTATDGKNLARQTASRVGVRTMGTL
jgi:hypothetical protein